MNIKKTTATITKIVDLSKTAREYTFATSEPLDFIAGNFVNVFMEINGEKIRRAFSMSSSDSEQGSFIISVRLSLNGVMTSFMWENDLMGKTLEIMGPLGLNTADKMQNSKARLFAYGVGAGVIKSVLDHVIRKGIATDIVVMTGSRSEDEILHKEYFDAMATEYPYVEVRHVVSQTSEESSFRQGYIQDHIDNIDFNNADVYACGQTVACDTLVEKIKAKSPENCHFFIEAFH